MSNFKLSYSTDGSTWTPYNSGEELTGNTNKNGKVSVNIINFKAKNVRIIPT